jgi:diadenylate cyclase
VFSYITEAFSSMRWQDIVDILLITFILYRLYAWIQGTRALRILLALAGLGLLYLLARWSGLFITTWILQYLWAVILVIMVVVFQSEIRQVLERLSPLRFFLGRPEVLGLLALEEVVRAAFDLAQKRIGALMVFQRRDILKDHLKGGITLNGNLSYEILIGIFLPNSPAHDGAVIIQEGRIVSMGCYLPLSDNTALPRNFGSRHRAGIGITERSDAISLIISEERGEVLFAQSGGIRPVGKPEDLKTVLESILIKKESAKGRWQTLWTRNLIPKVVSLILVFTLWSFLAGAQRAEMRLTVPLQYQNIPANMEIAEEVTDKVEVGIRGSRGIILNVTPDQVRAHIDLGHATPGSNSIRLTTNNIRSPLGTEVTKIEPSAVKVKLEMVKTRPFPVKPTFIGKLRKEVNLQRYWVDPPSLLLQGPESTLNKIQEILTEPIDLAPIKGNTKISVGVQINSPQVRLAPNQPSQILVSFEMERGK